MKRISGSDNEKNRYFVFAEMDRGIELPRINKLIQHELLCSMDTPLIQVSYKLEAYILHEGLVGPRQEVPSLFFPCIVTRDSRGPADENGYGS